MGTCAKPGCSQTSIKSNGPIPLCSKHHEIVDTVAWIMNENKAIQVMAQVKQMGRKFTLAEVHYQPKSADHAVRCGQCTFFHSPSTCKVVDGHVRAEGLCVSFVTKVYANHEDLRMIQVRA